MFTDHRLTGLYCRKMRNNRGNWEGRYQREAVTNIGIQVVTTHRTLITRISYLLAPVAPVLLVYSCTTRRNCFRPTVGTSSLSMWNISSTRKRASSASREGDPEGLRCGQRRWLKWRGEKGGGLNFSSTDVLP